MKKSFFALIFSAVVCGIWSPHLMAQQDSSEVDTNWVRFRGPNGQGAVSSNESIPSSWDKGKNVAWDASVEGLGSSSPVVFGGKIFVTSYTGFGLNKKKPGSSLELKRHLICLDLKTGKELWNKSVPAKMDDDPYKGFIQEHGYSSSSPVTDGKSVIVNFGRAGLFAFDFSGEMLWSADLGKQSDPRKWGLGASPVIADSAVVVNCGNVDRSIKAFDLKTGKEKWTVKDEEFKNSWSTPITMKFDGKKVLIFNMPGAIYGFEPETGKELWKTISPVTGTACASLAKSGTVIYTMGGRGGKAGAMDCAKTREEKLEEFPTARKKVWASNMSAGIGTPIVVKDSLLWHSRGILYRANRLNGKVLEKVRLPKPTNGSESKVDKNGKKKRPKASYASLVAVGDRIFLTSDLGLVYVYQLGEELELLESNQFEGDNGRFSGTPAISGNNLIFRAEKKIFCVRKD